MSKFLYLGLEFLNKAIYVPKIKCSNKKELLRNVAHLLIEKHHLKSFTEKEVLDAFLRRERYGSTSIGRGIAIPHVRLWHHTSIYAGFFTVDPPIDFDSWDTPIDPVFLIIGYIAPEDSADEHLKTLAFLAELTYYSDRSNITQLETPDQLKSYTKWY